MTIKTNAQLLLAGLESSPNTDPLLTSSNAVPTGKFIPGYNFQELQRLVVNKGIDAAKKLIGRETIDFNFEVELMASGVVGVEPAWGKLLEACGFTKSMLNAATVESPVAGYDNLDLAGLTVTSEGTFLGLIPRIYKVEVTTAGDSEVAEVSVECLGDEAQDSVENLVTTAVPISLGDEGATITFVVGGDALVKGDCWYVYCYPQGIRYRPTAYDGSWKTAFFYHYLGGLLFKGGGAVGNVSLIAPAGELARLAFDFQSVFDSVSDAPVPDHDFGSDVPEIVEHADLHVDSDNTLTVENITIESNNTITAKRNVNAAQGVENFTINARDNQFALDPEAKTEADFDFWQKMRARSEVPINFKVGSVIGNMVHVQIRRAVFDTLAPTEQEDILRYGITGQCRPTLAGNDNIEIFVC